MIASGGARTARSEHGHRGKHLRASRCLTRPIRQAILPPPRGSDPGAARGIDVDEQGYGTVTEQRLYQLIRQPKPIADRQFEIEFLGSGVEVFAFTFG